MAMWNVEHRLGNRLCPFVGMGLAATAANTAVAAEVDRAGFGTVVAIILNKTSGLVTATEHLDDFFDFHGPKIEVVL